MLKNENAKNNLIFICKQQKLLGWFFVSKNSSNYKFFQFGKIFNEFGKILFIQSNQLRQISF